MPGQAKPRIGRTLEDLSQREIAEVLGITAVINIAVRFNRARSELTRRLGERP